MPTQAIPTQQPADQAASGSAKQRLRDRLWSFRALIAVSLASVIVGGLGGAALANVSDNGNDGRLGPGRFNRGDGPGGPWGPGGPGMMNGGPQNGQRPDRRDMGQRPFDEDGGPGGQRTPAPVVPTPTS